MGVEPAQAGQCGDNQNCQGKRQRSMEGHDSTFAPPPPCSGGESGAAIPGCGNLSSLPFRRPREQDVVLQVDMLVQIGLHSLEFFIQGGEGRTGVGGKGIIAGDLAEFRQRLARALVLVLHLPDGTANRSEAGGRLGSPGTDVRIQGHDIGEEDLFFLFQVQADFGVQGREQLLHLAEHRSMLGGVGGQHLLDEPASLGNACFM